MSTAWNTIEDGLRAWVKTASGLTDAHVLWAEQTGARPTDSASAPFITLRLGDIVPVGGVDEVEELYDAGADPGEEIELRVAGVREFRLSIQAFGPATVNTSTARALLSKVQAALGLPSVRTALAAAGVTPFDRGTVLNVSVVVGTKFEGRAVLDVGFYCLETTSEVTGYITSCTPANYMGPPASGTKDAIDI